MKMKYFHYPPSFTLIIDVKFDFQYYQKGLVALLFFSGLLIMQILSINYSLHFGSFKIRKQRLYWKVFSTGIYRKIIFNCLLSLQLIFLSVNCTSWVSRFHNLSLTCSNTDGRFIFEGFKYCQLWKVHVQLSGTYIHKLMH